VTSGYFDSRVAVITGAGSGIGRALAVDLASRGAWLALSDIDATSVAETARKCRGLGARVHEATVDVTDWAGVSAYSRAVVDEFDRVDLLFCVAGIIHTGELADSDPSDVEHLLAVNVMGVVHASKAFLPHLIASSRAHLVTVSSGLGLMAAPRYSAYSATKFAVRGLSEALRQEMALGGHDVMVTCAYPGGIRTPIMSKGRFAAGVSRDDVVADFEHRIARTSARDAAAAILRGVERGRARVLVGRDALVVSGLVRASGGRYPDLVVWGVRVARRLRKISLTTRRGR
jgi:NADP-dependent 3-hydroxy acid dehydrogenase YdfG